MRRQKSARATVSKLLLICARHNINTAANTAGHESRRLRRPQPGTCPRRRAAMDSYHDSSINCVALGSVGVAGTSIGWSSDQYLSKAGFEPGSPASRVVLGSYHLAQASMTTRSKLCGQKKEAARGPAACHVPRPLAVSHSVTVAAATVPGHETAARPRRSGPACSRIPVTVINMIFQVSGPT